MQEKETEANKKVGRPLKFKSVEDLQEKIDAYFNTTGLQVDKNGKEYYKPITITGLALALDTTRETLMDYQNKDEYSYTIKKAKLRCENFAEENLFMGKSPTGSIFALKNYGWSDKTEHEHKGEINSTIDITSKVLSQLPDSVLEGLLEESKNND